MARRDRDQRISELAVPECGFSRAFGIVARCYFDFAEGLEAESEKSKEDYGECPTICPENRLKRYDHKRTKQCDTCPRERHWKHFRSDVDELWAERGVAGYGFTEMLDCFYRISAIQEMPPDKLSLKSSSLLAIFRRERQKAERSGEMRRAAAARSK